MYTLSIYEIANILREYNTDFLIQGFEVFGFIETFDAITWTFPVKKVNLTGIRKDTLVKILNDGFIKGA